MSMSIIEAATKLNMSKVYLTRLCEEGRIASYIEQDEIRIRDGEVDRILAERIVAKKKVNETR
jgi:hypothetical protein